MLNSFTFAYCADGFLSRFRTIADLMMWVGLHAQALSADCEAPSVSTLAAGHLSVDCLAGSDARGIPDVQRFVAWAYSVFRGTGVSIGYFRHGDKATHELGSLRFSGQSLATTGAIAAVVAHALSDAVSTGQMPGSALLLSSLRDKIGFGEIDGAAVRDFFGGRASVLSADGRVMLVGASSSQPLWRCSDLGVPLSQEDRAGMVQDWKVLLRGFGMQPAG